VRRDDSAEDACRDQRQKQARNHEPPLTPSLACLLAPNLRAGVRVDRLEDVPGRQGVEN
jgi:hypothetical protein